MRKNKILSKMYIAMYDSGCQICCNCSRLKLGFYVPAHWSTMPKINMIPHPVTLNYNGPTSPVLGLKWW